MELTQLLETFRQHGEAVYSTIFAASAWSVLTVALLAGYEAQRGTLSWASVVGVCWAGTVLGDAVRFWIGRRIGIGWMKSWPRLERVTSRIALLVDRHYLLILMFHRYPNGIRSATGFACGISKLPASTFLAINFVTGGIWAVLVVSAGYAFGHVSEKALNDAASGVGLAMLALFLGTMWFLSKKLDRAVEPELAGAETKKTKA